MNYIINKKSFEFTRDFLGCPVKFDNILLHQLGECMLEDAGAIKSHEQKFYEIIYVISGDGTFVVDGERYDVFQGDVHLLTPGKIHEITTDCTQGFRFAYVGFDFDFEETDDEMQATQAFYSRCDSRIARDNGNIYAHIKMLINEWYNESKLSYTVIASLLKCVVIITSRVFKEKSGDSKDSVFKTSTLGHNIYAILHYIDNNAVDITGVGMVADKFGYTSSYLSRLFKTKVGKSIQDYIIDEKIKYAVNLLNNTNSSISEIAERLKYSSTQAFCKIFKKRLGCTPTDYRDNAIDIEI